MAPRKNDNDSDAAKAAFNRTLSQKIRECADKRYGEKIKMKGGRLDVSLNQTTIVGWAFVEFYVRKILRPNYRLDLEVEVDAGLRCGGSGDFSIDFGYRQNIANNRLAIYICQGKYVSDGGNVRREDISDFVDLDSRIRSGGWVNANDNVRDLFRGLSTPADYDAIDFHYFFVTNGRVSKEVRDNFMSKAGNLVKKSPDKEGVVAVHLYDGDQVRRQYIHEMTLAGTWTRQAQSRQGVGVTVEIPVRKFGGESGCINLSSVCEPYQTVALAVSGTDIKKMLEAPNLFYSNIREHLGHGGRINKGMLRTLNNMPEMFYLHNNGMSALCSRFEFSANRDVLKCHDFQIINGAQTASTFEKLEDPAILQKAHVLLRITGTGAPAMDSETDDLRVSIIESNNSQNPVRLADFHSNDPIQVFLQNEFAKVRYWSGKPMPVFYVPKRGGKAPRGLKTPPKPKELKMEDLAKAIYAYDWKNPAKLYSQSAFLFGTDEEGVYWDLFGDESGNRVPFLPPERVQKIIAIAFLRMHIDQRLRESRKPLEKGGRSSVDYMSYCSGWHFLWAFGQALHHFYSGRENEVYQQIVNGDALQSGNFVEQWVDKIEEIIQGVLAHEANRGGDNVFNYKVWQRSKEGVEQIGSAIERVKRPQRDFPLP